MTDKIPSGKLSRTKLAGVTAAKVGAKHLSFLGKKAFKNSESKKEIKELHEKEIGKIVFSALAQLRGAALKVSQMLSMEADLLPESIRVELAKSCYNVKPLNRALIRKVFLEEFGVAPEKLFKTFDSNAFAAASLGQVHNATSSDGVNFAVKIQYPGIATSIKSDMKIIRSLMGTLSDLTDYLPKKDLINFVMDEIELRLTEEVDYYHEAESTKWFKENYNHKDIIVPQVINKFSGKRVLCFEKINGLHLNEWLETNPSQEQRDHFGQILFDTFWDSLCQIKRLHADPHPGNYLFMDNGKLSVLDYGCTVELNENFPDKMVEVMLAHLDDNKSSNDKRLFEAYQNIKIIPNEAKLGEYEEKYKTIFKNYQEWFIAPYLVDTYDFSKVISYPKQSRQLSKQMSSSVGGILKDQVYFDRSYVGLLSILRALKARVNCKNEYLFGPRNN
jgi:predicted unusual protein kinase regulating ubiquinone biosynthesis (AarF/ABC1/UbiB family)